MEVERRSGCQPVFLYSNSWIPNRQRGRGQIIAEERTAELCAYKGREVNKETLNVAR